MSRRVTRAYVRQYAADKIDRDQRKGRIDQEVVRYGREAYARYKKREGKDDGKGKEM